MRAMIQRWSLRSIGTSLAGRSETGHGGVVPAILDTGDLPSAADVPRAAQALKRAVLLLWALAGFRSRKFISACKNPCIPS